RVVVPGPDLAVHADLADAARDQLGVLRAEVEDQDLVGMDVGHGRGGRCGGGPRPAAHAERGTGVPVPLRSASADLVVRRLLGDGHVVDVGLALAGAGDAHELRPGAHLLHRGAAHVAHRRAQAAGQLVDDAAQGAAVRHPALDAFGHQLVDVAGVLEVAV